MKLKPFKRFFLPAIVTLPQTIDRLVTQLLPTLPPGLKVVGIMSLSMTLLVGSIEHLGGLETLELKAYDGMMRLRLQEPQDSRLLLVTITEADIRAQQQTIPSDAVIAQVLATLEQYQPAAIGLDLYRDVPQPPGETALQQQLQSPQVIVITNLGNSETDAIPPPANVPPDRIGFNDFPVDADGIVRRSLLFGGEYTSFSLQLAWKYLARHGIQPQPSRLNSDFLQLGDVTFTPLESQSGGYQTLDDRGYQILLNYRNHQPIARTVSLRQVLQGQLQPEWVKDKIVLIGTTAPSRKDLFYTPFSAGQAAQHQTSGVELHAQMLSQILSAVLDQRPLIWFLPEWADWAWIGLWAGAGGCLAWWIHRPVKLGLSGGGLLLGLVAAGVGVLSQAGWILVVSPAVATVLTAGLVLAYRAQQSQQQQQMVMALLGQNTSKEIADALWRNREMLLNSGKLAGQKLVATMLFTDICGFSTISESLLPENLLEWLNEYLAAMTQEVQRHHGIINKFTGDGMLAVFGVPMPRLTTAEISQDAHQAVACALAMGDRLAELNQIWQQRQLPVVQMRVGIFTGTVVVGSLGGKDRSEYGVIGDSVNIASRLESCAKDRQDYLCRVLIAEETLIHIQDHFSVEAWGKMELRGKQQMVEVYRVLGYRASASDAATLC